jgi:hypothetical protein
VFWSWVGFSRFEDQRCKEVKAQRRCNEDRRQDEAEHHEAVWQRAGAGRTVRTGGLARPVNQPIAISEAGKRRRDEIRLIGRERREVADPRAAYS